MLTPPRPPIDTGAAAPQTADTGAAAPKTFPEHVDYHRESSASLKTSMLVLWVAKLLAVVSS